MTSTLPNDDVAPNRSDGGEYAQADAEKRASEREPRADEEPENDGPQRMHVGVDDTERGRE